MGYRHFQRRPRSLVEKPGCRVWLIDHDLELSRSGEVIRATIQSGHRLRSRAPHCPSRWRMGLSIPPPGGLLPPIACRGARILCIRPFPIAQLIVGGAPVVLLARDAIERGGRRESKWWHLRLSVGRPDCWSGPPNRLAKLSHNISPSAASREL